MRELDSIMGAWWKQYKQDLNWRKFFTRKLMWANLAGPRLANSRRFDIPSEQELMPIPEIDALIQEKSRAERQKLTREQMEIIERDTREHMEMLKDRPVQHFTMDNIPPEAMEIFAQAFYTKPS